ncbi:hypothetical protein AAVH_11974 [Aphelenchoides avenae]|nr:hypothetical protein AAVH_11974 [Aphelenchus avenae]
MPRSPSPRRRRSRSRSNERRRRSRSPRDRQRSQPKDLTREDKIKYAKEKQREAGIAAAQHVLDSQKKDIDTIGQKLDDTQNNLDAKLNDVQNTLDAKLNDVQSSIDAKLDDIRAVLDFLKEKREKKDVKKNRNSA